MNERLAFEITIPGTWLDLPDKDVAWDISNQISTVLSAFSEATLALIMFERYQLRPRSNHSREEWMAQSERRSQVQRRLEEEAITGGRTFHDWHELHAEAERVVMIEDFRNGELPREIAHNEPFILAKTFLYAADTMDRVLTRLAERSELPPAAIAACLAFKNVIPQLRGVRNSAQHIEDRARGLGTGNKPLDLKPIDNSMIKAPGGALVLNSLNGNRYGSTMADGHYGEVEVSAATLAAMRDALEGLVNALKWHGPVQRRPR
jgi:hypothetical protein